LGVAYLTYASPDKAKKAISGVEQNGFFENTKILTKYVAVNVDAVNLIVYTESAGDKIVLSYLDSIPNKILNTGGKK
jgi:4-hydroxyphenylpyruvate dioxygenase-like putative hemolysin